MAAPTEFLTLNQVSIPMDREDGFREMPLKFRRRARLSDASLTVNSKRAVRSFEGTVTYVPEEDGLWIENLLDGLGEVWLGVDSPYSRNGFGPSTAEGVDWDLNASGILLHDAADGFRVPLTSAYASAGPWTMLARLDEYEGGGATVKHIGIASDAGGNITQSVDGATEGAVDLTDYLDNFSGNTFVAKAHATNDRIVRYLAVLPYALPQEQLNEWTGAAVNPPHLPFLRMGGTCLRGRDNLDGSGDPDATLGIEVLIERGDSDYEDANFGDGDGTQHAVKIPFSIEQR